MAASRNKRLPDLAAGLRTFLAGEPAVAAEPCWIGLSGGCDSIVLLHLLADVLVPGQLTAIHVHHGLSPHADRWAAFCADTCRALAVPLHVERVTVDRACGAGLEGAARTARYQAFARHARGTLFLAQHRGDQAETVLFNLLRGTGVRGAAGMPACRVQAGLRLCRPLLTVPRREIEAWAHARGLDWVEDESNADPAFSRNYLRHVAWPVLNHRFPAAEASFSQAAAHFAEAAGLLDELAEIDRNFALTVEGLQLAVLRQLSPARLANLLRWQLHRLGWQVPATARLQEFVRQLLAAGPDRHPRLTLAEGELVAGQGVLRWKAAGLQTVT